MLGHRPVNDQIPSVRLQTMTHSITIIQVYLSTAEAEEDIINSFYIDLQNKVYRAHKIDILIVVGNFNSKIES